jgi:sugar (pentulose or hexulose) kinase
MATRLLLGLDIGTTQLKVCLFDTQRARLVAEATRRLTVRCPSGGGRETPLRSLDRQLRDAVGQVRLAAGGAWRRVAGIGLAAQGGSSILADRQSGRAHTPMVLWNDGRTVAHTARLAGQTRRDVWRKRVLADIPPAGLGRLAWLKETRPELFRDDMIHVGAGEYIFFRLTREWRQDAGNAIQIGCYDAARGVLSDTLLRRVGVPLSFFAPLRVGHQRAPLTSPAARRMGLPTGLPVAGPYIDQEASYLAALGVVPRPLQCSLGTAWVGNFVLPEGVQGYAPVQLVIGSPAGPGRLVILPLLAGNVSWDWGLETLMGWRGVEAFAAADRALANWPEAAASLVALPWWTWANPLAPDRVGAGGFIGIGPDTDRVDMLRALAASMVFELARVFAAVKQAGVVDGMVLGGGASRSKFFRKLIALLFDPLPVFLQQGEASNAARGALYAFDTKVATAWTRRIRAPRSDKNILRAYELYLATFESILGKAPEGAAYTIDGGTP